MSMQALLRSSKHIVQAALSAALLAAAGPGMASTDWDMVGVKLGMTESEVRTAFQAYDPKGKIIATQSAFSYSDKVSSFRTPPFLNSLELRVTRKSIQTPLKVWFSGPMGDARVIGIARQEYNLPNPSSSAEFEQGLQAKYGKPTGRAGAGTGIPVWEEAGKPSCIRVRHGIAFGDFPQVTTGQKNLDQATALLNAWHQQGPGQQLPVDPATCGVFMYFTTNMDPLQSFTAGMYDVGAIMKTRESRNQWVDQLEAEAIRKRQGQGQAPRL